METSKLRKRIIEVAYRDGMGHIPSALSILDLVKGVYDFKTDDDLFILSKGHGCMALYAVLEEKGLLDWSTKLMGHPKRGGAILASTGSLGHGLPMAIGLAKAKKIKGEAGKVYVLLGDGECNEGTTWESALLASHHKLDNLVVIVDWNKSSDRALVMDNIAGKFYAFGFSSWEIYGHSEREIKMALETVQTKPLVIVAETDKGKGIEMMEGNPEWHNKKISDEDYRKIMEAYA
jgi:transketolase